MKRNVEEPSASARARHRAYLAEEGRKAEVARGEREQREKIGQAPTLRASFGDHVVAKMPETPKEGTENRNRMTERKPAERKPADVEPVSVAQAEAERTRIVNEMLEIQGWLAGRNVQGENGARISSVTYHRERATKVARLSELQARARFLKVWLRDWHLETETTLRGGGGKVHPNERLFIRLYHAVGELEDRGVDVGPEIEALLDEIEMALPPRALALGASNDQEPK